MMTLYRSHSRLFFWAMLALVVAVSLAYDVRAGFPLLLAVGALKANPVTSDASLVRDGVHSVADTTNSAVTYTAAGILSGYINRAPAVAQSDVTPTAALLAAALTARGIPLTLGMQIDCFLRVLTSTITVTGGTGVTIVGLAAVPTAKGCLLKFICTNPATPTFDCLTLVSA